MDPSWNELKEQLKEGPFPQKGFNKQLQWKIEENLERKSFFNKARIFTIASAGTMMILLAIVVSLNWTSLFNSVSSIEKMTNQVIQVKASQEANSIIVAQQTPVKSVLLIGLRTDYRDKKQEQLINDVNYSEYRSIMITGAPQNSAKLEVAAEGRNILMPYGQQFWTIEPITEKNYQYLTAYPANATAQERKFLDSPIEEQMHNEKLLFAANKYVSILEGNTVLQGEDYRNNEKLWVHTVNQLREPDGLNLVPTTLQQIFGEQINFGTSNNNWAITRDKGQWIPQISRFETNSSNSLTSYTLQPISYPLPESVVSYDKLSSSWEQIIQTQPKAVDAISSPDGDMLAILTTDKLYVYSYVEDQIGPLALELNLKANESLVMAQWATAQYADFWIESGKKYLKK